MSNKKIVLFDIDGTLLSAKGLGMKSADAAFLELYGTDNNYGGFDFTGRTDPDIFQEIAHARIGRNLDENEYSEFLSHYVKNYKIFALSHPVAELKPGIVPLLEALTQSAEVALGIETGNIKAVADIKLESTNVQQHFSFGGFACDSNDRRQIVRIAIERAKALHNIEKINPKDVFVVGDALQDIDASKSVGATSIAVETGGLSREKLQSFGADHVFSDLSDLERFLDVVVKS